MTTKKKSKKAEISANSSATNFASKGPVTNQEQEFYKIVSNVYGSHCPQHNPELIYQNMMRLDKFAKNNVGGYFEINDENKKLMTALEYDLKDSPYYNMAKIARDILLYFTGDQYDLVEDIIDEAESISKGSKEKEEVDGHYKEKNNRRSNRKSNFLWKKRKQKSKEIKKVKGRSGGPVKPG
ncbi:MAG: hypothetical protein HUJ68_09210 [Clostridia bacterium]|nr:hypothetical protein [Clostridia bacterium]